MMTIQAYRQNKTTAVCAVEMMALLLEKAASTLMQALTAIQNGDFEKRNSHSMMAQDILQGLEQHLPDLHLTSTEAVESLRMYYQDTSTLILRMNIKNDASTAQALIKSLNSTADMWRRIKQQANDKTSSNSSAEHTMAIRA